MNFRSLSLAVVVAAMIAVLNAGDAAAQSQADPVLARVNGVEIRQSDLVLAEADIGPGLPASTAEARRDVLVSYLIDVALIASAAEAKKLGEGREFNQRLAHARKKVLMESLLDQESKSAASESAMRQVYDESVKKLTPEQEVRARHILVETEDLAKEAVRKLKAGADFVALAKELSKDPGAAEGGDLGYLTKDQLVPEFAEVAFKLEKGKISEPVKTQFGWHVIKLENKREQPVPTYDEVKGQIEAFVVRKAQAELVLKLRETAKIERLAPTTETPATPPATGTKTK